MRLGVMIPNMCKSINFERTVDCVCSVVSCLSGCPDLQGDDSGSDFHSKCTSGLDSTPTTARIFAAGQSGAARHRAATNTQFQT